MIQGLQFKASTCVYAIQGLSKKIQQTKGTISYHVPYASTSLSSNTNAPIWSMSIKIHGKILTRKAASFDPVWNITLMSAEEDGP